MIPAAIAGPLEHEFRHAALAGLASVPPRPGPKNTTKQKPGREAVAVRAGARAWWVEPAPAGGYREERLRDGPWRPFRGGMRGHTSPEAVAQLLRTQVLVNLLPVTRLEMRSMGRFWKSQRTISCRFDASPMGLPLAVMLVYVSGL